MDWLNLRYNKTKDMSKPVILTGLRANNDLTLGNYFGGLLPIIDMAKNKSDEYQINLFVPDLHSFTTPIDHNELQKQIWNNLRLFVAAGLPLDNDDVHLYRQSYVPAHSELTWILDCFTGMGEMGRMTQFKEKSKSKEVANKLEEIDQHNSDVAAAYFEQSTPEMRYAEDELPKILYSSNSKSINVGLFNYPVLMASDILLYNATYVPVGDDQSQHLEFTRDIAERLNKRFGDVFTVPKPVKQQHEFFGKDQGLRIKDLADPTKKMSKSDDSGKGVIFLSDAPETSVKKIMSATTDDLASINFDREKQPGISNLLEILALTTQQDIQEVTKQWQGKTSYGEFKQAVAEAMSTFLTDFQSRLSQVDDKAIQMKLETSETELTKVANETLLRAQKAVGLR